MVVEEVALADTAFGPELGAKRQNSYNRYSSLEHRLEFFYLILWCVPLQVDLVETIRHRCSPAQSLDRE